MSEAKTVGTMSWWWSRDQERFHGPCYSRADAIMEAWADDADEGAFICQAEQGELSSNLFQAEDLAERFDDVNEEMGDPDGDAPSSYAKDGAWERLTEQLNARVKGFVREQGLTSWAFRGQTTPEWIDIPAICAALLKANPHSGREGGGE